MNHQTIVLLALGAISQVQAATVIQVSGFQTELVGTTKTVLGSGTPSNYNSGVTVGRSAVFDMTKNGADFADLRVTYQSDNGSVGSKIMIARTVNSQGLVDNGTISVLITTAAAGGGTLGGGVGLRFDWFAPGSFVGGVQQAGAALLTEGIHYTTFDIDYLQYVTANLADLDSYYLHSATQLTADVTKTPGVVWFEDNDGRSTIDRPEYAAQFLTRAGAPASHEVKVGKQASPQNALFIFEFRDPSTVLDGFVPIKVSVVPEPTNALGIMFLSVAGLMIRHRRMRS